MHEWHNLLSDATYEPYLVAENAEYAAFYKPPGLETIDPAGGPSLTVRVRDMLGDDALTPVHRLDRDTSGLSLFARGRKVEEELALLFRRRAVDKRYLAICLGVPRNRTGVINRNLSAWSAGRKPVAVVRHGGLEASTAYEKLADSAEFEGGWRASLLAFMPRQGRTHQIRVHASAFGYPILGDDQYGDRPANRLARALLGLERQALHCRRLSFEWRGKAIALACPLPPDMRGAAETAFHSGDW